MKTAKDHKDERMYLLIETLGATGIRTVSAVYYRGSCDAGKGYCVTERKDENRLLPMELRRKLRAYAGQKNISTGSLFVTRSGRQMDPQ